MSHELHQNAAGKTSFAYVGQDAWHGLGQQLSPNSPIPVWIEEAGFNFEIKGTPVMGQIPETEHGQQFITLPDRQLLYRNDTNAALSVVSEKYKIVQPAEVLQFYEDLVETGGFHLETAGVMFGGKRFFALAKTSEAVQVVDGDPVAGYLLLCTSCDGSLATSARFTSVRTVCWNTLSYALQKDNGEESRKVSIPHSRNFDPTMVKEQLGLAQSSFDKFIVNMRELAKVKLTKKQEVEFLIDLFGNPQLSLEDQEPGPANLMKQVHKLYSGAGMGAQLVAGTAWGMLNAVTEYTDHHTGHKTQDARMDSAWFGQNSVIKERAQSLLLLHTA